VKHLFARASLALAVSAGFGTIVAAAPAADSGDPIDLFAKLMPVFSHARCINCHGRVDPFHEYGGPPQVEHGGEVVGDPDLPPMERIDTCGGCHAATPAIENAWMLATLIGSHLNWVGKNTKEMCELQAHEYRRMKNAARTWMEHLNVDILITQAFDGMAGGAREPPAQADPPPLKRGEFLKAAQDWVNAGASCGGWEGTITQTENFASSYSYPWTDFPAPSRVEVNEQAQRTVTIKRSDGQTTIKINQGGRSLMKRTAHMDGPNGPCQAVYTDVEDWTGQNNAEVPAELRIRIAADGSYTIHFAGPIEKTLTTQTGDMANDCSIPSMHSADSVALDWPVWRHTIRCPSDFGICQMFDPDSKHLSGTATRTLMNHEDAADPYSWLETSPVGISRSDDGTQLPVKVKTIWDLTLTD
jgi:cytochrome c553